MDIRLRLLRKDALTGGGTEKDRYIAALERVVGSSELPEVCLQGKGMNAGYRIMQALGDKCSTTAELRFHFGGGLERFRKHMRRLHQAGAVGKIQNIRGHWLWFATAKVVRATL